MKALIIASIWLGIALSTIASPRDSIQQYLSFAYGAQGIQVSEFVHSHPDLWMIPGERNPGAIESVLEMSFDVPDPGVYSGTVGKDLIFLEVRDGKVDPAYPLEGIYALHRNLILHFLLAAMLHDQHTMEQVVTEPENVELEEETAAGAGDVDVYAEILSILPVLRASSPASDEKTKTVTYRMPLGEKGFELTLRKMGSTWRIDSSRKLAVPLRFFFQ